MHRFIRLLGALLLVQCAAAADVKFGIDVLRDSNFAALAGKRVGLVVNPASVDEHLASTVDVLHETKACKLVALFGPEHGVRGAEYAGDKVEDNVDPHTGLPV